MKTKSNDDMINLITSQDIIEGSWDENEEKKTDIVSVDKETIAIKGVHV